MELILLAVPACPSAPVFEERLAAALAGHPGAVVRRREVADHHEAADLGMHGSPTLLVDGCDPFAEPGMPTSLSCRLYRDQVGHAAPAPSVDALQRVIAASGAVAEGDVPEMLTRAVSRAAPRKPALPAHPPGAAAELWQRQHDTASMIPKAAINAPLDTPDSA